MVSFLDLRYNLEKSKCPILCPKTDEKYKNLDEFPFLKTHLAPDHDIRYRLDEEICKNCAVAKKTKKHICKAHPKKAKKPAKVKPAKVGKLQGWKVRSSISKFDKKHWIVENRTDEEKSKMKQETVKHTNVMFAAEPTEIRILNYKKNVYYERNLYIRNKTSTVQSIVSLELSPESKFSVKLLNRMSKIAPGMACHLKVSFKTDTYTDIGDQLLIHVSNGESVQVFFNFLKKYLIISLSFSLPFLKY